MLFKYWKPVSILFATFLGVCPVLMGHAQEGSGTKCFAEYDLVGKTYDEIIQALVDCHSKPAASNAPTSTQRSTESHQETTKNGNLPAPQSVRTNSGQVRTARKDVAQEANSSAAAFAAPKPHVPAGCSAPVSETQYRNYRKLVSIYRKAKFALSDKGIEEQMELQNLGMKGKITDSQYQQRLNALKSELESETREIEFKAERDLRKTHTCLMQASDKTILNLTELIVETTQYSDPTTEFEKQYELHSVWSVFKTLRLRQDEMGRILQSIQPVNASDRNQLALKKLNLEFKKESLDASYTLWRAIVSARYNLSPPPPDDLTLEVHVPNSGLSYDNFPSKIEDDLDPPCRTSNLYVFGRVECLIVHFKNR